MVPGKNGTLRDWSHGYISEYKDAIGRSAATGTYDDLAEMSFSCVPSPGSSGGPVVDIETGAVVGLTRGSHLSHGDGKRTGFGTPSERIFEVRPA